ncbi:MAG TPA: hypothetical protein VFG08_08470 [Candidatus Polarisedimenticolia bacterium]|nr:hypothetical protein [Candidatus Polarisedimenticolia bacterium]
MSAAAPAAGSGPGEPETAMDRVAEAYVKLALALGRHDADYVDAYSGPDEWKAAAERDRKPLAAIRSEAAPLIDRLARLDLSGEQEIVRLRREYLSKQLQAMITRVDMQQGARLPFDEESRALYDAVSPRHPESHYQALLQRLDAKLPGEGPLVERYVRFKEAYVIPPERLDEVFTVAIEEARRRTRQHLDLPEQESFVVEYVTGKPWSGYNWYKGNGHSLIEVNTDLPIHIDRAVDLACHEGYPGHHVYNVLLEHHLAKGRGWVEFVIYPLFSPQSLISEGSANYGREVAFAPDERLAFERDVLFPLAGLDPRRVRRYYEVLELAKGLRYAGNDAARRYLDGEIDKRGAVEFLNRYALMSMAQAGQRVEFIDRYRSYVINYNLGEDLVKAYIEGRGGTAADTAKRWQEFGRLLASPRLPSGLGAS